MRLDLRPYSINRSLGYIVCVWIMIMSRFCLRWRTREVAHACTTVALLCSFKMNVRWVSKALNSGGVWVALQHNMCMHVYRFAGYGVPHPELIILSCWLREYCMSLIHHCCYAWLTTECRMSSFAKFLMYMYCGDFMVLVTMLNICSHSYYLVILENYNVDLLPTYVHIISALLKCVFLLW